ncbi:MAG: GNAT family N-acetyltransferase [Muribaculaceae bacterium]|nr:GNAT family N-acetyltransferase [Muribaculaceae bacterium]
MNCQDSVKLRAVEPIDADMMYEVENDSRCWRYGEVIAPLSRRIIRDYALNYDADPFSARQLRLIITCLSEGCQYQAGVVDLYEIDPIHRRAFVGIYILPPFRERGIAHTALRLLEDYAAQILRLRKLAARIESINTSSIRLFEKATFVKSATLSDWFSLSGGGFSDMLVYTKSI